MTFTIALGDQPEVQVPEVSGWLLKKKRKRMQGWAKRWFTLSPSGVLSYATSQQSVIRGSIQILVSTITYKPNLRQIHIDSGTMIYHLKSLTESDYEQWQTALMDIRKKNGETDLMPPSVDDVPKRLSRMQDNTSSKRIRAEIEQGVDTAETQAQNVDLLATTIHDLKNVLIANDLGAIQSLIERLDLYKMKLVSGSKEQQMQWRNVQNYFNQSFSHRRSGSISPIQGNDEDAILEDLEVVNRSSSAYSRLSAYSDQFFDAEDIVLSGDEEEDAMDHSSLIDNEDSSDDEETGIHQAFFFCNKIEL